MSFTSISLVSFYFFTLATRTFPLLWCGVGVCIVFLPDDTFDGTFDWAVSGVKEQTGYFQVSRGTQQGQCSGALWCWQLQRKEAASTRGAASKQEGRGKAFCPVALPTLWPCLTLSQHGMESKWCIYGATPHGTEMVTEDWGRVRRLSEEFPAQLPQLTKHFIFIPGVQPLLHNTGVIANTQRTLLCPRHYSKSSLWTNSFHSYNNCWGRYYVVLVQTAAMKLALQSVYFSSRIIHSHRWYAH